MKTKKVVALLLCVFIACGLLVFPVTAQNAVWDGSASDTSWYEGGKTNFTISTAPELAGLSKLVGTDKVDFTGITVTLAADIDLGGNKFTPIGANNDAADFNGVFDGGGHLVKNFTVGSGGAASDCGLFGRVTDGVIKNLGVENVTFHITHGTTNAGAVVGYLRNSKNAVVENCYAKGVVFDGGTAGNWGGLVGNVRGSVRNCYTVDVQYLGVTLSATMGAGVGYISNANGSVDNFYAGQYIKSSYNKITGAGRNDGGTASNVFFDTYEDTSGTVMTSIGTKVSKQELTALSVSLGEAFQKNPNPDYHYGYPVLNWETVPQDREWDGVSYDLSWYGLDAGASSFAISTAAEFAGLGKLVAGRDSVLGTVDFSGKTITLSQDLDFGGHDLSPVGMNTKAFKGTFDGGGHIIRNVNMINGYANDEVGLFARLQGGKLMNLGLCGVSIVLDGTTVPNFVGGLTAHIRENAAVERCFVREVTLIRGAVGTAFGALAGQVRNAGAVKDSYAVDLKISADVPATNMMSSLVGYIQSTGADVMQNCYAGNYNEMPPAYGKIVGAVRNNNTNAIVEQVFYDTYQEVSAQSWADQAVGEKLDPYMLKNTKISDSFELAKTYDYNFGYPILSWEADRYEKEIQAAPAALRAQGVDNGIVVEEISGCEYSLDGERWQQNTRFENLKNGTYTVYARYPASSTAYSSLPAICEVTVHSDRWNGEPDTAWYDADLTEYTIGTPAEFLGFAQLVSSGIAFDKKTVTLRNDLDMLGYEIMPVGTASKPFMGIFDGGNNSISNVIIAQADASETGLFARISGGTVKNLGLSNGVLKITADVNNAGGLAGSVRGAEVENCFVKDLKLDCTASMNRFGGLIGYAPTDGTYGTSTVNQCYITGFAAVENAEIAITSVAGYGIGAVEGGKLSNIYAANNSTTDPIYKTLAEDGTKIKAMLGLGIYKADGTTEFENCYYDGCAAYSSYHATYPAYGALVSTEKLTGLDQEQCALTGFAVDYYDENNGYPILESEIPVCYVGAGESPDFSSGLPKGGKVVADQAELTDITVNGHLILSGTMSADSITANGVEVAADAQITGKPSISANNVTLKGSSEFGTINGSGTLDLTEYTGHITLLNNVSGFSKVYGPRTVKTSTPVQVYFAQYTSGGTLVSVYTKGLDPEESVNISEAADLDPKTDSRVFVWTQNNIPVIESYTLYSEPVKVLILGNSITWHAPKSEIGWTNAWGMAASSEDKDYVHVFEKLAGDHGYNITLKAKNIAGIEKAYTEIDSKFANYSEYQELIAWEPDVIIVTAGANMTELTEKGLKDGYGDIIRFFNPSGKAKIISGVTVLTSEEMKAAISETARENSYGFVDASDLTDEKYLAPDFDNQFVAAHPGDEGMRVLAQRLFEAFEEIVK